MRQQGGRIGEKAPAGPFPALRILLAVLWASLALLLPSDGIQAWASGPVEVSTGRLLYSTPPDEKENDLRTITRVSEVEADHWQLLDWQNGRVVCEVYSRNNNGPAAQEVINACGSEVYLTWITTPACRTLACKGLMLRFVARETHTFSEKVTLPEITFQAAAENCVPGEMCEFMPVLTLQATEPVTDFQITYIHLRTGDHELRWDGADCRYELPETDEDGEWIEYWADSSFGDQSDRVRIKYRNVRLDPDQELYRLDILGSGWAEYAPSGSLVWYLFPPVDGSLSSIFEQPFSEAYLYTTNRYAILTSHLIKNGIVDTAGCPGGGLFANGSANACGEERAAVKVLEWQNRYDGLIYQAAVRYNVPARVIKGMIAQETQFWRGPDERYELGLGKLTENGADMLLNWNTKYFLSLCIPHYQTDRCSSGYDALSDPEKLVLKGDIWKKIGTDEEFDLLAAALLASAAQTGQVVENSAESKPEFASSYEDMWRLTVANYYSGSGCIHSAIGDTVANGEFVTWENVSEELQGVCGGAVDYVERVMDLAD